MSVLSFLFVNLKFHFSGRFYVVLQCFFEGTSYMAISMNSRNIYSHRERGISIRLTVKNTSLRSRVPT